MPLTPSGDLSAATWITGSDLPWFQLVTFGPQQFGAYARLRFLPDPTSPGQEEAHVGVDEPEKYDLLRTALEVLYRHTRTPDDLYFCIWDGWGAPAALQGMPKVTVPARDYFLFRGTLADFDDQGARHPGFELPQPAFIWPADHSWCIANDVDPHFAVIGAAPEAIAPLLAHPALDVVTATLGEQQLYYR